MGRLDAALRAPRRRVRVGAMRLVNGVSVYSELREIVLPERTALLVVDMQNDLVHPDGWFAHQGRDVGAVGGIVPRVDELVRLARTVGVLPIFVEQVTLPNSASDPPAWLYFKTRDGRRRTDYALRGSWGQQIADRIDRRPGDICVEKFRPSAFHQTALDLILRRHKVESLLVCGVVTQGCVQATVLDASFHDYYTVVVEDCVQSFSQELHHNALTFMRSRYDLLGLEALRELWSCASGDGSQ